MNFDVITDISTAVVKSINMLDKCITFNDFKKVHPFIINTINQTNKLIVIYGLEKEWNVTFNLDCLIKATEAKHTICRNYSIDKLLK